MFHSMVKLTLQEVQDKINNYYDDVKVIKYVRHDNVTVLTRHFTTRSFTSY